jgi:hypothetical protein
LFGLLTIGSFAPRFRLNCRSGSTFFLRNSESDSRNLNRHPSAQRAFLTCLTLFCLVPPCAQVAYIQATNPIEPNACGYISVFGGMGVKVGGMTFKSAPSDWEACC